MDKWINEYMNKRINEWINKWIKEKKEQLVNWISE